MILYLYLFVLSLTWSLKFGHSSAAAPQKRSYFLFMSRPPSLLCRVYTKQKIGPCPVMWQPWITLWYFGFVVVIWEYNEHNMIV